MLTGATVVGQLHEAAKLAQDTLDFNISYAPGCRLAFERHACEAPASAR